MSNVPMTAFSLLNHDLAEGWSRTSTIQSYLDVSAHRSRGVLHLDFERLEREASQIWRGRLY